VTTPQAVSTFDVGKAIAMFKQVNVDILGIVENMSGYAIEGMIEGAKPGTKVRLATGGSESLLATDSEGRFSTVVDVFGKGGAERLCKRHGFPLLGSVPLNPVVRVGGDAGDPVIVSSPDSLIARLFREIAGKVAQRLAIKAHQTLPILQ
jgi:ATP-binding protein involved in chromosome partitioning